MEPITLTFVRLKQPMPWNGPADLQLDTKHGGEIQLHPNLGLIRAVHPKRVACWLPTSAVAYMQEAPPKPKSDPVRDMAAKVAAAK